MDWGDGTYELTGKALEPATRTALDALGAVRGLQLIDVGCGSGNVAMEAAKRGAKVTAVDPSARLVEVTRQRAAAADLQLVASVGTAAALPGDAATYDVAVSVMAVIFAPDADAAAAELVRVVRPGGRIVLTAWLPYGPLFEASMVLRRAMATHLPANPALKAPRWGDPSFVRELFAPLGGRVESADQEITFAVASIPGWFEEQELHHPVWRAARRRFDDAGWATLRADSIEAMRAASASETALTSPYVQYVVTR